jgi:Ornithine decarboxylase antizyme
VCVRDAGRQISSGYVSSSPRSAFYNPSLSIEPKLRLISPRPVSVPGATTHVHAQAAFSPYSSSVESSTFDEDESDDASSSSSASLNDSPNVLERMFRTISFPSALEIKADLWEGAILDEAHKGLRTLYVESKSYDAVSLRENVVSLIERADEEFACTGVVFCLRKNAADLGKTVYLSLVLYTRG